MHSTDVLDDGYIGSGVILNNAIKKYGVKCLTCEIVQYADSVEELRKLESDFITIEDITSDQCYNIAMGGRGGKIVLFPEHPKYAEVKEK